MAQPIRTLVTVDTGVDVNGLSKTLTSDANVTVVGIVEGLEAGWRALQDSSIDVLTVACAGHSERALVMVDGSVKQDPDRPVLVLAQESPTGFVQRVFEAGADDILMLPQGGDQIRFAVQKLMARKTRKGESRGTANGRLICVLGTKGGAGKTLTSSNLAVALADAGHRVVIVDLDLQFGDVGLCLGVGPDRTFYDLALAGGSIDAEKLEAYLMPHPTGLKVLVAPTRPDQASSITVELVREVYGVLRSSYDIVIVDTPPGFTAEVIATIDNATDLVVVGMLDALSLKNTKLALETLELMGCEPDTIRMVLNRAQSQVGISQGEVSRVLGREPDVMVPSDREIPRAVNEGVPITLSKPGSEAASAFKHLAAHITGDDGVLDTNHAATNGQSGRRRLFGRKP